MGELAAVGSAILWAYASIEFACRRALSALTINLLKCTGGLICLSLVGGARRLYAGRCADSV